MVPDLAKLPSNEAMLAFFDMSIQLTQTNAERLAIDLTVCAQYSTVASRLLRYMQKAHPGICTLNTAPFVSLQEGRRSCKDTGLLAYSNLAPFLDLGHDHAVEIWDQRTVDKTVLQLSKDIRIFNQARALPSWTASDGSDEKMLALWLVRESIVLLLLQPTSLQDTFIPSCHLQPRPASTLTLIHHTLHSPPIAYTLPQCSHRPANLDAWQRAQRACTQSESKRAGVIAERPCTSHARDLQIRVQ